MFINIKEFFPWLKYLALLLPIMIYLIYVVIEMVKMDFLRSRMLKQHHILSGILLTNKRVKPVPKQDFEDSPIRWIEDDIDVIDLDPEYFYTPKNNISSNTLWKQYLGMLIRKMTDNPEDTRLVVFHPSEQITIKDEYDKYYEFDGVKWVEVHPLSEGNENEE